MSFCCFSWSWWSTIFPRYRDSSCAHSLLSKRLSSRTPPGSLTAWTARPLAPTCCRPSRLGNVSHPVSSSSIHAGLPGKFGIGKLFWKNYFIDFIRHFFKETGYQIKYIHIYVYYIPYILVWVDVFKFICIKLRTLIIFFFFLINISANLNNNIFFQLIGGLVN